MHAAILIFAGLAAAVPMAQQHHHHHKRDYVWETQTEEVIVTVPVTKTVWIEPGETPPTDHHYGAPAQSKNNQPPVYTHASSSAAPVAPAYTPPKESAPAPAPTSTSSVYVAPVPTSSSVYVAPPAPTTYAAPPPAPTTYAAPAPVPTIPVYSAPAPAPSSSAPSSGGSGLSSGMGASGKTYTGDLTWYEVGMGACGMTSTSDEPVVAISQSIFDSYGTANPNNNPLCNKKVTITAKSGEKYTAKIVDRCTGCAAADLDLSQGFFNKVTNNGDGRVGGMEWCFD